MSGSDVAWEWADLNPGYQQLYSSARQNARVRGIAWQIEKADFVRIVQRSGEVCEVTGLKFSWARWPGSSRRPLVPSLDRIDSHDTYRFENCRLVAAGVNIALAEWGDEFFALIARALILKHGGGQTPLNTEMVESRAQKQASINAGLGTKVFLRTPDAALYLGVSVSYLEKARGAGGGPPFSAIGRSILYRVSDLATWAEGFRARNTSEARMRRERLRLVG